VYYEFKYEWRDEKETEIFKFHGDLLVSHFFPEYTDWAGTCLENTYYLYKTDGHKYIIASFKSNRIPDLDSIGIYDSASELIEEYESLLNNFREQCQTVYYSSRFRSGKLEDFVYKEVMEELSAQTLLGIRFQLIRKAFAIDAELRKFSELINNSILKPTMKVSETVID